MNPYSRPYLRERYLAEQQAQLAKDAQLADPAIAYRALLAELRLEEADAADDSCEQAA